MPRYRSFADFDEPSETAREVIVETDEPQFTGLYDADGNRLYRLSDKEPVGFKIRC